MKKGRIIFIILFVVVILILGILVYPLFFPKIEHQMNCEGDICLEGGKFVYKNISFEFYCDLLGGRWSKHCGGWGPRCDFNYDCEVVEKEACQRVGGELEVPKFHSTFFCVLKSKNN